MKKLIIIGILLLISSIANAEWVLNDSIGNDPDKVKLCISRIDKKGKVIPFEISSDFVKRIRESYPDATLVVVNGGLFECHLRQTTGRFEPEIGFGGADDRIWRLIDKPKQFKPGVNTPNGDAIAFNICRDAYLSKSNKENYSHSVFLAIREGSFSEYGVPNYKKKNKGKDEPLGGKKVERYDVVVQGKAFYKPANPDLTAVSFACLLSPMFEIKSVQFK